MKHYLVNILLLILLLWGGRQATPYFNNMTNPEDIVHSLRNDLDIPAEKQALLTANHEAILALQQNNRLNNTSCIRRTFPYKSIAGKIFYYPLSETYNSKYNTSFSRQQILYGKNSAWKQVEGYYIYSLRKIII